MILIHILFIWFVIGIVSILCLQYLTKNYSVWRNKFGYEALSITEVVGWSALGPVIIVLAMVYFLKESDWASKPRF